MGHDVAVVSIAAGGAQCAVGGNTCPSRALWEGPGTASKVFNLLFQTKMKSLKKMCQQVTLIVKNKRKHFESKVDESVFEEN